MDLRQAPHVSFLIREFRLKKCPYNVFRKLFAKQQSKGSAS